VITALSEPAAVGEDFNLGNPTNTLTIYELAKLILRLLHSRSRIEFVPADFSDVDIRVPNPDKARRLLGFQPRFEMEEAVLRTAMWYAAQLGRMPSRGASVVGRSGGVRAEYKAGASVAAPTPFSNGSAGSVAR
jgi:dTDP-D-glucose 4,6-dehydratase